VLAGTLPNLTQQNVFLGLPLVLMPEELVLLIEKRSSRLASPPVFPFRTNQPNILNLPSCNAELATIVHDPSAHHTPTPAQLEAWDASRRQDVAQLQLARLERLERQRRKDDDDDDKTTTATAAPIDDDDVVVVQDLPSAAPTRQKRAEEREARRRRPLAATATADADADADAGADADAEAETDTAEAIGGGRGRGGQGQEPAAATPVPSSNVVYTVSVPTTSDAFAWYNYGDDDNDAASGPRRRDQHHQRTYETLDAARAAGVWSYPANADERARCEVFRDLWEKGYYMGGGIKFGGDWLVYPGALLYFSAPFF